MNLSMLNQYREMKAKLEQAQKELSTTVVEAESGKGAVKVTINGQQKVQSIKISPKAVDTNNIEHLEELVLKAVTEAISKSQKLAAKRMGGLTGGLKIPGLG
jgi:DNA-binding YbaB/EbfC family protein